MLQCDVLALYLFIAVIDGVMRKANIDDLGLTTHKLSFSRIPEKRVGDLEYVDDFGLLENEKDKAQKRLDALPSVAKEVGGLVINIGKIKVLSKNNEPKPKTKLDETKLEMVDDFQYLGSRVNDTTKDFKHHRAMLISS